MSPPGERVVRSVQHLVEGLDGVDVIEKDLRQVIHAVAALEQYLDEYLRTAGLTFEEWARTFGQGSYRDRNLTILDLAVGMRPRNVLEFACAGPFLACLLVDHLPSIERYV